MVDLLAVVTLVVGLGWALAPWLDAVATGAPTRLDRLFDPVERALYRLVGVDPSAPMGWRTWAAWLLATNLALALTLYAVFVLQGHLPLNPDGVGGLSWDLALHTAASFVTNTNQQHYSGQAQLSYLSQTAAIVTAQIVTPAMGFAVMLAVLRGLRGGADGARLDTRGDRDLGHYVVDVVRFTVRVLLPLSTVLAVLLASQGVPSTLQGATTATPLDASAGMAEQVVPVGPVAAMVAIKQLGTNGGGWYGPNSTVPLENPTPVSNVLELVAILLLPVACAFLVGRRLDAGLGRVVLGVMAMCAVALAAPVILLEQGANPAFAGLAAEGANWEGKEIRNGIVSSALWASMTTMTSNGSVNAMHDSLLPWSGLFPFLGMFVNAAFGGVGVGVVNMLLYVVLAVFVAGLLVGRTPELAQRKVDAREIRLAALAALATPALVLVPSALAFLFDYANTSNPGPHGVSQVLYEYASAAANNGSGFEGLGDGTVPWNVSCAVVLILGRFVPMLAPLAIAGLLAPKTPSPRTAGSLSLGSPAFAVTVLGVLSILQLLTFVPALVLGPTAEALVAVPALAGDR